MVSGKYSALAGAVSREQAIANISNNLANGSTVGYKKSRVSFESLLRGEKQILDSKGINYSRIRENYSDFSQGPINVTDNPLDIAIRGDGFFKIQGPNGPLYTRSGNFQLDSTGRLVTKNGMPVLDDGNIEISIPDPDINKIVIDSNGIISTVDDSGIPSEVGTIGIVNIDNPLNLRRENNTMFSLKDGGVEVPMEEPTVSQGSLEVSNVNMTDEMSRMINGHRTFETYHKILESYASIAEKQDELGTVS